MAIQRKTAGVSKGQPLLGVRLSTEQRAWIKQQAAEQGQTESAVMRRLIDEAMQARQARGQSQRLSIVDTIEGITSSVPAQAWKGVPRDLSEQHDHYIYGTPKK